MAKHDVQRRLALLVPKDELLLLQGMALDGEVELELGMVLRALSRLLKEMSPRQRARVLSMARRLK